MTVVYSDHYKLSLDKHPWNTFKYNAIVDLLRKDADRLAISFDQADMADDQDILLVHTSSFWQKLLDVSFSAEEESALELPINQQTIDFFWRAAGGTIQATHRALEDGVAAQVGGGFHHAFPDHGAGFCLINDIAIGVQSLLEQGVVERVAVIDCDVHQGDGTAKIFERDSNVVTFSIHQESNYPFFKQQSNVDIGLPDGTGDAEYLKAIEKGLNNLYSDFGPFDIVHYQAGADPFKDDPLGALELTIEGLKKRDELVIGKATSHNIPIIVTLGGGYAPNLQDLAQIHANTIGTVARAAARSSQS